MVLPHLCLWLMSIPIAVTVDMALDIALAYVIAVVFVQPNQEKNLNFVF